MLERLKSKIKRVLKIPITSSEKLNTKEGREWIVAALEKKRPDGLRLPMEVCPMCEGWGKLGHSQTVEEGALVQRTKNKLCPQCEGTGLLGHRVDGALVPLSYRNIHCPNCEGTGSKNGGGCTDCSRTGVVKEMKV